MCVVAVAWHAHPRWRLVVAGNRDEYHARASAPLARWDDAPGIIAGRDLVSGGSWMGVADSGRFAVVTNIRDADGPDPAKLSRGALVADWLANGRLPEDADRFNPFNLIVTGGDEADYLSNRPISARQTLTKGIHGLSNAIPDEHWPRKDRLVAALSGWLETMADQPEQLLDLLRDETLPDRDAHPVFIRSPVYGTRCSTLIAVDHEGRGQIIERRFGADGDVSGESRLDFGWPI
jgi:uncharacterized protein with NRDE domain